MYRINLLTSLVLLTATGAPLAQESAADLIARRSPVIEKDLSRSINTIERAVIPASSLRVLAKELQLPIAELAAIEFYRANLSKTGGSQYDALIAYAPIKQISATGRLVLTMKGAKIDRFTLWGNDDIDVDPTMHWGAFLSHLSSTVRGHQKRPDGESVALQPSQRKLAAAILRQRRAMANNRQFTTAMRTLMRNDQLPQAAWFGRLVKGMDHLSATASELRPVLTEEAMEPFQKHAKAAAAAYRNMHEAVNKKDLPAVKLAYSALRKTCSACHNTAAATDSENTLFDTFAPHYQKLAPRTLRMAVGDDVVPALGDQETVVSQATATALRAIIACQRHVPAASRR